jgi:hypothetical protein
MYMKFIVVAAAIIAAAPVFATSSAGGSGASAAASHGGSSAASGGSSSSAGHGGGSSGGGHGTNLGSRGAANAIAARTTAGMHTVAAAKHSGSAQPARVAGDHHHHHNPMRSDPVFRHQRPFEYACTGMSVTDRNERYLPGCSVGPIKNRPT